VNATTSEIVLDASAALTGLLSSEGSASEIVARVALGATSARVPDLFLAEVTNAMTVRVSVTRWPLEQALRALDVLLAWPLAIQPCGPLAASALESAARLGISG
jgi:predicted nucleic acid-binding protein